MSLRLCLYSSAHGFGHTTRLLAVAAQVLKLSPQARIVINTPAPEWLVQVHVEKGVEVRRTLLDVGLVQSDSFTTDIEATLAQVQALQQRAAEVVAEEALWLKRENFDFVLADIPPLAAALAGHEGSLPVWGMSNFGWDFIYRGLGGPLAALVPWVESCHRQYSGLFRLPFNEPMADFKNIEPISLVASEARFDRAYVRRSLKIDPERPTALMTFGGLGLGGFPAERVREQTDWQFIVTASDAPDLPNITKVVPGAWRLIELLTAADLAIIKPGYSTVAECCALGIPVACLTRPGFAEAELLIEGIKAHLSHRILSPEALFKQPWDFLDGSLTRREGVVADGALAIAERILALAR